jgi:hypothetical protein
VECRFVLRLTILGALACLCASCGPRMREQVSVHPYQFQMPDMPAGTVPTTGRPMTLVAAAAKSGTNPLQTTPANLRNGGIYYGYYCRMCHGTTGDGNGPVGQSYVPKPADLTSPAVTGLSDGALYDGMLHGVGHDPVMVQTVLPQHRWPLVMYVRQLSTPPVQAIGGTPPKQ